jgi:tetratricopeptide (TPR) repeat protein
MKRSPFIAVVLGLVLALYIYTSSVRPKIPSVKKELSITEQIQAALSNIQDADNPQSQMKGILQMRSLSEKYPENADLQWNMGLFSIQSGQYEKAVARFEKVITIDAQRLDAYMQLAMSYLALQDTSAATNVLSSLIDKSEGDTQRNAEAMLEKLK